MNKTPTPTGNKNLSLSLAEPVVQQIEQLLNEVGPDDAVIIQKRGGHIERFVKQASIHVTRGQRPVADGSGVTGELSRQPTVACCGGTTRLRRAKRGRKEL